LTHGGKRTGAGRKPILDELERWIIGAKCERMWREECRKKEDDAIAEVTDHVREDWDRARAIPQSARADWLEREQEDGNPHTDGVRVALQVMQKLDGNAEPNRALTVKAGKPQGKQTEIVQRVALEESDQRGIEVKARLVRECWKEFRHLQKRLKTDES
jgi:hypothetical protein